MKYGNTNESGIPIEVGWIICNNYIKLCDTIIFLSCIKNLYDGYNLIRKHKLRHGF